MATRRRRVAITITPAEGISYADILKALRGIGKPGEGGAEVRAIKRTQNGNVLLELGTKTEDPGKLKEVISKDIGVARAVKSLAPKKTIEVRDLNCLTKVEEIEEAVGGGNKSEPHHA